MTTLVEAILLEMEVLEGHFNNKGVHDIDVKSPNKRSSRGYEKYVDRELQESPLKVMRRIVKEDE